MQPNNNSPVSPSPQQQPPVRPIHDVAAQPVDPAMANLERTGAVFSDLSPANESANPIAGTAAPHSGAIHEQSAAEQSLDGVLKQVTSNIKAVPPAALHPAKKKRGLFGGGKAKKVHPASASHGPTKSPVINPIHQTPPKPKKPVLPIVLAVIAAIGLGTAAVMAL